MENDLAKHVATTIFKTTSQMTELIPLLKDHCDVAEYESYAKAIASVAALASAEILRKIFAEHPDIEREFDRKINKYGKLI